MAWFNLGAAKPKAMMERRAERHEAHGLSCGLGDLVDLSVSGARIRCVQKPTLSPGSPLTIAIRNVSQSVRVAGRVAWVRRVPGLRSKVWDIGVQFLEERPGLHAALDQLARFGFVNTASGALGGDSGEQPAAQASQTAAPSSPSAEESQESAAPVIEVEDLYAILGVPRDAQPAVIKATYHKIAMQLHPDHNPDPEATERFARINKAWSVLRDPERRARYDRMLSRAA